MTSNQKTSDTDLVDINEAIESAYQTTSKVTKWSGIGTILQFILNKIHLRELLKKGYLEHIFYSTDPETKVKSEKELAALKPTLEKAIELVKPELISHHRYDEEQNFMSLVSKHKYLAYALHPGATVPDLGVQQTVLQNGPVPQPLPDGTIPPHPTTIITVPDAQLEVEVNEQNFCMEGMVPALSISPYGTVNNNLLRMNYTHHEAARTKFIDLEMAKRHPEYLPNSTLPTPSEVLTRAKPIYSKDLSNHNQMSIENNRLKREINKALQECYSQELLAIFHNEINDCDYINFSRRVDLAVHQTKHSGTQALNLILTTMKIPDYLTWQQSKHLLLEIFRLYYIAMKMLSSTFDSVKDMQEALLCSGGQMTETEILAAGYTVLFPDDQIVNFYLSIIARSNHWYKTVVEKFTEADSTDHTAKRLLFLIDHKDSQPMTTFRPALKRKVEDVTPTKDTTSHHDKKSKPTSERSYKAKAVKENNIWIDSDTRKAYTCQLHKVNSHSDGPGGNCDEWNRIHSAKANNATVPTKMPPPKAPINDFSPEEIVKFCDQLSAALSQATPCALCNKFGKQQHKDQAHTHPPVECGYIKYLNNEATLKRRAARLKNQTSTTKVRANLAQREHVNSDDDLTSDPDLNAGGGLKNDVLHRNPFEIICQGRRQEFYDLVPPNQRDRTIIDFKINNLDNINDLQLAQIRNKFAINTKLSSQDTSNRVQFSDTQAYYPDSYSQEMLSNDGTRSEELSSDNPKYPTLQQQFLIDASDHESDTEEEKTNKASCRANNAQALEKAKEIARMTAEMSHKHKLTPGTINKLIAQEQRQSLANLSAVPPPLPTGPPIPPPPQQEDFTMEEEDTAESRANMAKDPESK